MMTLDDATRRQLRFALFLQVGGFVMFLIALIVRVRSSGFDIVTGLFLLGALGTAAAAVFTRRQLH